MRNGFDTSNTAEDKQVAAWLAGTKAGADFSRLVNNGRSAGAAAAGKAMAADCAAAGVTVTFTADTPAPSPSASSQPAPAPTMTRQTDVIVFRVSGTGYPTIQYGSDSNSNDLPNGTALPWSGTVTYNPSALYYAVSAQLQGLRRHLGLGDRGDHDVLLGRQPQDGELPAGQRPRERRLRHCPGRVCGR